MSYSSPHGQARQPLHVKLPLIPQMGYKIITLHSIYYFYTLIKDQKSPLYDGMLHIKTVEWFEINITKSAKIWQKT